MRRSYKLTEPALVMRLKTADQLCTALFLNSREPLFWPIGRVVVQIAQPIGYQSVPSIGSLRIGCNPILDRRRTVSWPMLVPATESRSNEISTLAVAQHLHISNAVGGFRVWSFLSLAIRPFKFDGRIDIRWRLRWT